ncbi:hypothetical protein UB46_29435 [Burkholderiaceae bacterium 16]|nr:hypothetical protein UB46_29435 [Burkholderiaceae bacterium 16]
MKLVQHIKQALRAPTVKQLESVGRLAHTPSAACFIAATSLAFSNEQLTTGGVVRYVLLYFWGVILFATGLLCNPKQPPRWLFPFLDAR